MQTSGRNIFVQFKKKKVFYVNYVKFERRSAGMLPEYDLGKKQ